VALKDFEGKALLPEVSRRWKELSDAERAVYTNEATKVRLVQKYPLKWIQLVLISVFIFSSVE
jgi:hypothetical protein